MNQETIIGSVADVLRGNASFALVRGDNREAINDIPDASIDFVVADPCYAIGPRDPTPEEILAYLNGSGLDTGGDFMGRKDWQLPTVSLWREHYRVLKPGAHLAVFCGPQTADLMSMAIRLAGFERRDDVPIYGSAAWNWIQGQGMKKGLDVSKAIDEAAGAEREVVGTKVYGDGHVQRSTESIGYGGCDPDADTRAMTAASSPEAQQWDGWETDLASRHEAILIFRKPIATVTSAQLRAATGWDHWHVVTDYRKPEARAKACEKWDVADPGGDLQERDVRALDPEAESWRELRWREKGGQWVVLKSTEPKPHKAWTICNVAANVLVYGTGAISIDRCRVGETKRAPGGLSRTDGECYGEGLRGETGEERGHNPNIGRHPANCWFVHSGSCQRAGERNVASGARPNCNGKSYGYDGRQVYSGSGVGGYTALPTNPDGTESIPSYLCLLGCRSCGREWTAPSGGKAPACKCGGAGQWRCAVARLDAQSGVLKSAYPGNQGAANAYAGTNVGGERKVYQPTQERAGASYSDSGSASMFFPTFDYADEPDPFCYAAKSPRSERDAGLEHRNSHVAVKPQKVLEYLVRLVGAPGAVGLTAWAGSGSEVAAMVSQGCRAIGIEWDATHYADAMQRIPALVRGERRRAPDPQKPATVAAAPKPTPKRRKPADHGQATIDFAALAG